MHFLGELGGGKNLKHVEEGPITDWEEVRGAVASHSPPTQDPLLQNDWGDHPPLHPAKCNFSQFSVVKSSYESEICKHV